MNKIQKQSKRVRMIFQAIWLLTPIVIVCYWLSIDTPYEFLYSKGLVHISPELHHFTQLPLSMTTRVLATLTSLALYSIIMYALSLLIQLFKNYENNEIFSYKNALAYQKLGYCVFYWVLGSIIHNTLLSLIISFNNPPGERMITVSFVGIDFLTIVFGLVVLIVSWVMKEAYLIANENSHTV